jgi:hypothetical protein
MRGIARTLLYSCKKATEVIEKRQVVGISLIERARLSGHLYLCDSCSVYLVYSKKIDILLRKHLALQKRGNSESPTNDELRERLLKLFR